LFHLIAEREREICYYECNIDGEIVVISSTNSRLICPPLNMVLQEREKS